MKHLTYFLLITMCITACSNNKKQPEKIPLTFNTTEYKEYSRLENKPEASLTAKIPTAEGDSIISKNINNVIFNTIRQTVGEENNKFSNYSEVFSNFIKSYEEFIIENPDAPGRWEISILGDVEYNTPEIINIKLNSYLMTGGAHGNRYTTSLLFDPKSGKEIQLADIIKDTTSLTSMAEKAFRGKYNIPDDKSINSTGLMFPDDKFILPQNIFVSKDGLKLFYNTYEVAAYVEGTKEIDIPYDSIETNLLIKIK
ncbi:MAG: DUF3298 domain-containing protein [Dysgonomonas sp.]|nr:DUF3298 domain-containing protein [Dysgonomonas sp.]